MFNGVLGGLMEKFSVKRGLIKQIGGNAGLAKLATEYFDNVNANSDGEFTASFGILTKVSAHFDGDGKLSVDVEQLKGEALGEFLKYSFSFIKPNELICFSSS